MRSSPSDFLWRLHTKSRVTFLQMVNMDCDLRVDRARLKVHSHFLFGEFFMALLREQYNKIRFLYNCQKYNCPGVMSRDGRCAHLGVSNFVPMIGFLLWGKVPQGDELHLGVIEAEVGDPRA